MHITILTAFLIKNTDEYTYILKHQNICEHVTNNKRFR